MNGGFSNAFEMADAAYVEAFNNSYFLRIAFMFFL
jgi:hypothetical protein